MKNQVVTYLKEHLEASPHELVRDLGLSRQMLHRILNQLAEKGMVEKIGRPPKVFYKLKEVQVPQDDIAESKFDSFLSEHFNFFTEKGTELNGKEAFLHWCQRQKLPYIKTAEEFQKTREKYLKYYGRDGLIDGTQKIIDTKGFARICIDQIFYGDFYAIERFGKTKLGNLIHFAKQGQSKFLIKKIADELKEKINTLIQSEGIQAVGFIPPTIKRSLQFMAYFEECLSLKLPKVKLTKVVGDVAIPQKALSKISERIANAKASIVVEDRGQYERVLLIDDAIGSGATINETACKLKIKKTATRVIGFAVTGSYKGFEVIQEV